MGGVLLSDEQASYSTEFMDNTAAEVLAGIHPPKRKSHFSILEAYKETPVFLPMDMTEDVVESFARKLSGSTGPGGTDSEDL